VEMNDLPRARAPGNVVHNHSSCGALTRHRGARYHDEDPDPQDSEGASFHRGSCRHAHASFQEIMRTETDQNEIKRPPTETCYNELTHHLWPSHAYIPRSDSPGFEPATFRVLSVRFCRFIGAPEKNVSISGFSPLSSKHDITTASPQTLPGPQLGSETDVEGGGSSWAFLHTKIGLIGFRIRDLPRTRRALYRRTGKEWMAISGLSPLSYNHDIYQHVTKRAKTTKCIIV
jgi:hypothetical protein